MATYDDLSVQAPAWRSELEAKLTAHGGSDLVVPYSQVARAFPSREPNPKSFQIPLIDPKELQQWAELKGWHVQLTHDMEASDGHPPVRFVGLAKG
jgi:hypothetical protein